MTNLTETVPLMVTILDGQAYSSVNQSSANPVEGIPIVCIANQQPVVLDITKEIESETKQTENGLPKPYLP